MIITLANEKGGTGKSTTAAAIVSGETSKGKKVLGVDLDPQCTLSFIMGADLNAPGAYELMTGNPGRLVQHTDQGDIIAGNLNLSAADSTLTGRGRIYALQDGLKAYMDSYDYMVVDTAPTLGTLLINALTAANGVVIPLQATITSLQGFYLLMKTIRKAQADYNPELKVLGAVFTEYNGRTIASRDMAQTIRERADAMGVPVFKSEIHQGVAVEEAQIMRRSLFDYAPRSRPAYDYMQFLDELEKAI